MAVGGGGGVQPPFLRSRRTQALWPVHVEVPRAGSGYKSKIMVYSRIHEEGREPLPSDSSFKAHPTYHRFGDPLLLGRTPQLGASKFSPLLPPSGALITVSLVFLFFIFLLYLSLPLHCKFHHSWDVSIPHHTVITSCLEHCELSVNICGRNK